MTYFVAFGILSRNNPQIWWGFGAKSDKKGHQRQFR